MALPTVAVTGVSSCTGFWICRAFLASGWTVHGLCSQPKSEYSGLKALRLSQLGKDILLHYELLAEEGKLSSWVRAHRPGIWVHHHHFMDYFRSANYDLSRAALVGIQPLAELLSSLKQVECSGIIYSGTYFEPAEGGKTLGTSVTPYAQSKHDVWTALHGGATQLDLSCSKVVIANPIGPLENDDRLIPQLLRTARSNESFHLSFPENISDNIPVTVLAQSYVKIAKKLLEGSSHIVRPSGWVGTNSDWLAEINEQLIRKRLGYPACTITTPSNKSTTPHHLANPRNERVAINWNEIWDSLSYYSPLP